MACTYKFIDHTADIAVEVEADTLEELFSVSLQAWKETIFEGNIIEEIEEKKINIIETDLELLLVKFLNELNFSFQVKQWICGSIKDTEIKHDKEWQLNAVLLGELFNPSRHKVNLEIKAVTFHQMEIKKKNGKYSTRIVFDI
jgi:SHS2 domain-containing protein